jgi:hypothetical protein
MQVLVVPGYIFFGYCWVDERDRDPHITHKWYKEEVSFVTNTQTMVFLPLFFIPFVILGNRIFPQHFGQPKTHGKLLNFCLVGISVYL